MTGWLQVGLLVVALVAVHRPLGEYMARVFTNPKHSRVEKGLYRVIGVDPDADQRWPVYLRSVLAFSVVGVLLLYAFQRVQQHLLLSLGFPAVEPSQAFNTAASFVTNTNWQSYSGEATMGHLVQMSGLAVQNFVSAAVGMSVAVALIRGFARTRTDRLGNFWVDLTRASLRILLPLAFVAALVMLAGGVIQNLSENVDIATLSGGGFYNANSAHPFEGPTAWVSLFQIFLIFVIPFSLPRTFGRMVGDTKQGRAIVAVMAVLASASIALVTWAEVVGAGTAPQLAGAAMEGKEVRFGVPLSSVFAGATTLTSTGAVNSFHDSFTALGGGVLILNMMLGEIAPGGVGSGLYGMLVLAVVAVFVAGLMVGRTPEYLRKKISRREMTLASLYLLATPAVVLAGTAIAMSMPEQRASMLNSGPHGFSEVLYAFVSAGNNNGSAFAGISVNTTWYNTALGLAMIFGRFLPLAFVLALAGSLARQERVPVTKGTLPTHTPLFIGLLTGIVLILVGLTYFPVLALGPFAEGL